MIILKHCLSSLFTTFSSFAQRFTLSWYKPFKTVIFSNAPAVGSIGKPSNISCPASSDYFTSSPVNFFLPINCSNSFLGLLIPQIYLYTLHRSKITLVLMFLLENHFLCICCGFLYSFFYRHSSFCNNFFPLFPLSLFVPSVLNQIGLSFPDIVLFDNPKWLVMF